MEAMAWSKPKNDPFKLMAEPIKTSGSSHGSIRPCRPPDPSEQLFDVMLVARRTFGRSAPPCSAPALRGDWAARRPRLIAAIGFPFGALPQTLKQTEAEWAAAHGADELDVVPDFTALINGQSGAFAEELALICGLGLPVRVILDMARLPNELLPIAVEAAIDAGAAGVQTGNGFGPPASSEQIEALKPLCRGRCAIKAAGGIHRLEQVLALVQAGASLLGTSSAPQLLRQLRRPDHHNRHDELSS